MKKYQKFITNLGETLKEELPGMEAHLKMTPYRSLTKSIPENRREGAVLFLIYERNEELYFPLIQRNSYEGVHSNQVSLPGGKKEEFDADFYETAKRETFEEIGVEESKINFIGQLSDVYIPPSNFMVYSYVGFVSEEFVFQKEEKEVNEILEIPFSAILDEALVKETQVKLGNGMKLKTPYFDLNDKVVWGATAAILSEIKEVILNLK